MPQKKPKNQEYTAKNIPSLTPREHVRRRPGMYVGGTDKRAFHHLIWETVDNSIDEVMAGRCDEIRIILHSDTRVSVIDNGRGIPVETAEYGKTYLEMIMTAMFACGKFDNASYKISGGLHGVGVMTVNALSSEMIAEIKRDGYLWRQTYSEGLVTSDVEQIRPLAESESTGTSITFTPDFTIIDDGLIFDYDLIIARCRKLAYLLPNTTFKIEHEAHPDNNISFNYANGLSDWVRDFNEGIATIHPILSKQFTLEYTNPKSHWKTKITVDLALQFRILETGMIQSFVNTIETPDDGTHVDGLQAALSSAIYGEIGEQLIDPLDSLVAILHVFHEDPQLESQTKIKLLNPEVEEIVSDCVQLLLAENPDVLTLLQNHFQSE